MIGLDTNVLIRYIAQDDAIQTPIATRLFESFNSEKSGFISVVALIETAWVLCSFYDEANGRLRQATNGRVHVKDVTVFETDSTTAKYSE